MGDPSGIGAEIILKSLPNISRRSIPVIVGDWKVIEAVSHILSDGDKPQQDNLKKILKNNAEFVDLGILKKVSFGISKVEYGEASYRYIMEALKLLFAGEVSAIVTCPINKKSINSAGIEFVGHTELLAHHGGVNDYVMMMANKDMRVSLVTIHIPLKDVPGSISVEKILKTITITSDYIKRYFGLEKPHLKVCGLNPHAGEDGIMGHEETMIDEAIKRAQNNSVDVEGPFPADTLFRRTDCDAFVAMYHDQGLIPVKTTDFARTINITLGLPFVRVSPGHGTGYDIAGKGIADPTSLMEAYRVAEEIISNIQKL